MALRCSVVPDRARAALPASARSVRRGARPSACSVAASRRRERRRSRRSRPGRLAGRRSRRAHRAGDRRLEGPAARGVVDEHVEAGGGRAEQDRRPGPAGILGRPAARPRRISRAIASARATAASRLARRARCGPGRPPGTGARGPARSRRSGPTAAARSATTAASSLRSTPLSRPPAIEDDRRREGPQRRDHGIRLGALRVVDEADAVELADRLEAMLDAAEARRPRAGSRPAPGPKSRPTAIAASAFETLWRPGSAQLGDGQDPAARPGRGRPVRRRPARRSTPAATIQSSTTPTPPGIGRSTAVHARPVPCPGRRRPATTGSSALRTRAPVGIDQLGQAALHRAVGLQAAVAVEVVGGDVGVDGDRRAARQRRQLQLATARRRPDASGVSVGQALDQRPADVAAEDDPVAGIRGEEVRRSGTWSSSCPSSR